MSLNERKSRTSGVGSDRSTNWTTTLRGFWIFDVMVFTESCEREGPIRTHCFPYIYNYFYRSYKFRRCGQSCTIGYSGRRKTRISCKRCPENSSRGNGGSLTCMSNEAIQTYLWHLLRLSCSFAINLELSTKPSSSSVEGDEQPDRPNMSGKLPCMCSKFYFGFVTNTTAYRLGRYSLHLLLLKSSIIFLLTLRNIHAKSKSFQFANIIFGRVLILR